MLGIFLYCVGVMYTPGPVNILSLNSGIQNRFTAHIPFCIGVGTALCFWFILVGYTGSAIMNDNVMPIISSFGAAFILYLAYKIITSDIDIVPDGNKSNSFNFRDGVLMQLLNPKSFLAVLPVTAVQFPAAGIEGNLIALWSIGLGVLGCGAPLVYAIIGTKLSKYILNKKYLRRFNYLMGAALIFVALDLVYNHIYHALL